MGVVSAAKDGKTSVDAKVVYGTAGFCSVLGLVLLVVGAVVYINNADDGEYTCLCPGGDARCCKEVHSMCAECWCKADADSEGQCADFEHTGQHGGSGLGLAIAGLVVSLVSAAMLITMHRCKDWSEKNLHVRYPAVTPGVDTVA